MEHYKPYSRRFKLGISRFSTRATVEEDYVIIQQSERIVHPKIDNRNSITLSVEDFRNMIKVLGLE